MTASTRPSGRHSSESHRRPLWFWSAVGGSAGVVAAVLLTQVLPLGQGLGWLWPGDASSASTALQLVATSVMTATTLTFSLTVVALQLASQQFSPRLLREFTRDPVIKAVLAVLTTSFAFTSTALRALRSDAPVPEVALVVGQLLGLASFAAILAFITHMVRMLRVDTMMREVHDDTARAIADFYPRHDDPAPRSPGEVALDPGLGRTVVATRSGFVEALDADLLVRAAREHDALVRVELRPGDQVLSGTPLATLWRRQGARGAAFGAAPDELVEQVRGSVAMGYERTFDQDASFGFRQLEDIAVKAMSPSVNDPATAATAVGHMGDLLVRLLGCRLGPTLHEDADGVGRAVIPDRDLRYYLDLACGQLQRFSAAEPTVMIAMLRMLRDVAPSCRDDSQRAEVARAARGVLDALSPDVRRPDAEAVEDLHRRVEQALAGDLVAPYADRAGETRSI